MALEGGGITDAGRLGAEMPLVTAQTASPKERSQYKSSRRSHGNRYKGI